MNFEEKINEELKNAIKKQDKTRIDTLRSIRSAIIEFNKSGSGRELNSEDEIKILQIEAKKRKDAIEIYEKTQRKDLLEKEKQELAIIQEFLPKQLSEEEITEIIKKIIIEIDAKEPKDFGKVMSVAMKDLKGKADGSIIQRIVKDCLNPK